MAVELENEKNLEDQVYEHIMALLFKRGVADANNLSDKSIAETLGVSRTPVRIAFARMESEGLVQKVPGRGWIMAPLSRQDIEEIFELKEDLETSLVRRATERMTPEAAKSLMAIADEMREIATAGDVQRWLDADERFHEVLFGLGGNERLKRFIKQINNQYRRFRVGFLSVEGRMEASHTEHRKIAEAMVAGDADLAVENTLRHFQHVRSQLIDIMEKVLIPFLGQEL